MSSNSTASNSNKNRLYTRFITILKIIQFIGYVIVVLSTLLIISRVPIAINGIPTHLGEVFLFGGVISCFSVYVVTQGLIAIIDLLSRIERNTRSE